MEYYANWQTFSSFTENFIKKKKSQKEMHFLKKIIYIYYKVQYFQAQKLSQKHFENGVGLLYKGMD